MTPIRCSTIVVFFALGLIGLSAADATDQPTQPAAPAPPASAAPSSAADPVKEPVKDPAKDTVSPGKPAKPPATPIPSEEDILREMLKDKPPPESSSKPLAAKVPPPAPLPDLSVLVPKDKELGPVRSEGTLLLKQRGHLVRIGEAKTPVLVLDGVHAEHPERPLVLLPCRKLEEMERVIHEQVGAAPDAGAGFSFIVSGVVSQYRDENYLLLQRVEWVKADKNLQ